MLKIKKFLEVYFKPLTRSSWADRPPCFFIDPPFASHARTSTFHTWSRPVKVLQCRGPIRAKQRKLYVKAQHCLAALAVFEVIELHADEAVMTACQANRIILDKIKSADSLLPLESCSSASYSTSTGTSELWQCHLNFLQLWSSFLTLLNFRSKTGSEGQRVALMVKSCDTSCSVSQTHETFGSCDMWQNLMVQRPERLQASWHFITGEEQLWLMTSIC